jgi:hypothetical protein
LTKKRTKSPSIAVGWREWLSLPELGAEWIKAKVDTGARSSSLHAFGIETDLRAGQTWVRFEIHPWQHSSRSPLVAEAPVLEFRDVKSSSGTVQHRPVIRTLLRLGAIERPIELTLTRRDEMGFRMLLGREALRGQFLVDPGRSFLCGRPPIEVVRANRRPR